MDLQDRNRRRRAIRAKRRRRKLRARRLRRTFLFLVIVVGSVFLFQKFRNDRKNEINLSEQTEPLPQTTGEVSAAPAKTGAPKSTAKFFDELVGFLQVGKDGIVQKDVDDAKEVGKVAAGEYVENFGSKDGWTKIRTSGKIGYLPTDHLQAIRDPKMFCVADGVLLVNKNYGLPADYDPGIDAEAQEAFELMAESAKRDAGLTLKVASGYRNYEFQETIHENYVKQYGEDHTNSISAKAGHSEHQTGLAFDIMGEDTTARINSKFDDTAEAKWLEENAGKFGFILRYPKGKEEITGYVYESWHFRYVGVEKAAQMIENDQCLEEYLSVY